MALDQIHMLDYLMEDIIELYEEPRNIMLQPNENLFHLHFINIKK